MRHFTIYHNPRCSKSRQTLALLEDRGITPTIVRYLDTPLTPETLATLVKQLGFASPHELVRSKEATYKTLGLSPDSDPKMLLEAMAANPSLIERPIVVCADKAVLGRPPENVLTLL
jgi:arsenate reductase